MMCSSLHELKVEPRYRELGIEAQVIRKIIATIGYHTAVIVFDPAQVRFADSVAIRRPPSRRARPSFRGDR